MAQAETAEKTRETSRKMLCCPSWMKRPHQSARRLFVICCIATSFCYGSGLSLCRHLTHQRFVAFLADDIDHHQWQHLIFLRQADLSGEGEQILLTGPLLLETTQVFNARPAAHNLTRILRTTACWLDHLSVCHNDFHAIKEIANLSRLHLAFHIHRASPSFLPACLFVETARPVTGSPGNSFPCTAIIPSQAARVARTTTDTASHLTALSLLQRQRLPVQRLHMSNQLTGRTPLLFTDRRRFHKTRRQRHITQGRGCLLHCPTIRQHNVRGEHNHTLLVEHLPDS